MRNTLFYKIQFPIDMTESLEVNNIIAYPLKNSNGTFSVAQLSKNVLLSSEKQLLFLSREDFFTGCKQLKSFDVEHLHLCDAANLDQPKKRENAAKISIPISNKIEMKSVPQIWLRLHDHNSFLFSFQKEENIFSICDAQTFETSLHGFGVCRLNNSCVHSLNNELIHTFKKSNLGIPNRKIEIDLNLETSNITLPEENEKLQELKFNSSVEFQHYFTKINENVVDQKKTAHKKWKTKNIPSIWQLEACLLAVQLWLL